MKIKKLLFLGAMLLIGGNAMAELVERQKPVFTPNPIEAYTDGTTSMYLYNPGAKKFFCGGNSWGTQSSVGEVGYRVYFKQHLVDGVWDGTTVEFLDSCLAKSGKKMNVFFDNVNGGCFVDRGSQANYFWKLEKNDVYYRLSMAETNPNYQEWQVDTHPNTYWGWCDTIPGTVDANGGKDDYTRVFSFLPASEHNYVDWAVCAVADVEAYYTQLDVYNAAQELKAAIEDAAAKGADVSAAEAVYNNAASTIEDFNAAILALNEATASASDPVDMTPLITNPSYDNNNNTGWKGDGPGFQSFNNAEFYNKNYDSYQDITGMPKGVYLLTLQAFYRSGGIDKCFENWKNNEGYNSLIYTVVDGDTVTTPIMTPFEGATADKIGKGSEVLSNGVYLPNNMEASAAYFAAGRYMHKMMFAVDGNAARIGLKKTVRLDTDWTIWDNWTLTYYGSKEDAYQAWVDQLQEAAPKYNPEEEEELWITEGMLDEYNSVLASNNKATNKAEIMAAKAAIDEAVAKITANVAAWRDLKAALNEAAEVLNDTEIADGEAKWALGDYAFEVELHLETLDWTTEQIVEETAKLRDMTDDVVKNNINVDADVTTKFLVNADYSEGTKGWQGKWTAVANGCMEAYETDWDAYQIVEGAPLGAYEVSLQGFYRVARGNAAYESYKNGQQKCPGHVYVNNNMTEVPCVFTEPVLKTENIYSGEAELNDGGNAFYVTENEVGDSICFPNTMATANEAFAKGMYQASAFGLVAKKGDVLRLGVKGARQTATWVIWDNFKMYYRGFKAEVIKPELQKAVDNAAINEPMSADVKALFAKAVEDGKAALAQEDGKVMFDALAAIFSANDSASASIAAYKKLSDAASEMYVAAEFSPAAPDVVAAAQALFAEIMDGIDNGTYKNEDIDPLLVRIAEMTTKLSIPAGEASDANPLDLTVVIKNPNFDKDGANSVDGWSGTSGYNFGNDDTQKSALLLEFFEKKFDMYQDIIGLPNGTYEVGVSAFCRFGSTTEDYTKFQADPSYNEAWLYAIPGNDSTQMATAYLKHLAADAAGDKGYSETATIEGTELVVPNSMVSAKNYFETEGLYKNSVIVKVTDGKLRIGIKKEDQIGADWVIMDNWTLKYFGENSAQTPSGDIVSSIESIDNAAAQTVKVEFFGINGAQTSGLQKGINIVKSTMSDGSVVVKKLIVR